MFEVALVYKPSLHRDGVIVAQIANPRAVELVKKLVLEEAIREAAMWERLDAGCYKLAIANLARIREILGIKPTCSDELVS